MYSWASLVFSFFCWYFSCVLLPVKHFRLFAFGFTCFALTSPLVYISCVPLPSCARSSDYFVKVFQQFPRVCLSILRMIQFISNQRFFFFLICLSLCTGPCSDLILTFSVRQPEESSLMSLIHIRMSHQRTAEESHTTAC